MLIARVEIAQCNCSVVDGTLAQDPARIDLPCQMTLKGWQSLYKASPTVSEEETGCCTAPPPGSHDAGELWLLGVRKEM